MCVIENSCGGCKFEQWHVIDLDCWTRTGPCSDTEDFRTVESWICAKPTSPFWFIYFSSSHFYRTLHNSIQLQHFPNKCWAIKPLRSVKFPKLWWTPSKRPILQKFCNLAEFRPMSRECDLNKTEVVTVWNISQLRMKVGVVFHFGRRCKRSTALPQLPVSNEVSVMLGTFRAQPARNRTRNFSRILVRYLILLYTCRVFLHDRQLPYELRNNRSPKGGES